MPKFMFRNNGGKQFVDVTAATGTGHLQKGHGVAFGDINNDGNQDIYINIGGFVPGDAYNKALFSNPGHSNNWIGIKLRGVKTNRQAIGAKIKLTLVDSAGRNSLRYREVNSGGSFGSSPLAQVIGLGKAKQIETIEVQWPVSNTVQRFQKVGVNQFIEIEELAADYQPRNLRSFFLSSEQDLKGIENAKKK
jgi:ASPIC and UnbV/FG-GAP-like repeat